VRRLAEWLWWGTIVAILAGILWLARLPGGSPPADGADGSEFIPTVEHWEEIPRLQERERVPSNPSGTISP
jgi:hypothetical protein